MSNDDISLTPIELKMIEILEAPGHKVVRDKEIINYVWGVEWPGVIYAIYVNISRLRKKLIGQNLEIIRINGGYMMIAKLTSGGDDGRLSI